ncbi:unnamed protein product [Lampetra planeri]
MSGVRRKISHGRHDSLGRPYTLGRWAALAVAAVRGAPGLTRGHLAADKDRAPRAAPVAHGTRGHQAGGRGYTGPWKQRRRTPLA